MYYLDLSIRIIQYKYHRFAMWNRQICNKLHYVIMHRYLVKIWNILRLQDKTEIRHRCSPFLATIRHAVRSPFINTVGLTIFREGVKCLCTLVNLSPVGSSPYAIFFSGHQNSLTTSKKYNCLIYDSYTYVYQFYN